MEPDSIFIPINWPDGTTGKYFSSKDVFDNLLNLHQFAKIEDAGFEVIPPLMISDKNVQEGDARDDDQGG